MNRSVFSPLRGKNVLVTGHTGFKGSWLAIWLHSLGAKVTGLALAPNTSPNNFDVADVRGLLAAHHQVDLRNETVVRDILQAAAPDVVLHLAAQAIVRESYAHPRGTFDVNVMGTVNVLEAVRAAQRPCVVVVATSDKCYDNREQEAGYRETDALGGRDPYSASKGAAEIVVAAYRSSFFPPEQFHKHGVKLATVRAGNVIGGGDWAKDRIVVDMARHLAAEEPIPVRNPRAVRPWQHVLEPLAGYLSLACRMLESDEPRWCGAWNFGPLPKDEIPVAQLVQLFLQVWGSGTWNDVSNPNQPHEAGLLRLNIEKAMRELVWRPRWSVAEAVGRTAAWYRNFYSDPKPEALAYCRQDIAAYENLMTAD